jgi:hypothetical protein
MKSKKLERLALAGIAVSALSIVVLALAQPQIPRANGGGSFVFFSLCFYFCSPSFSSGGVSGHASRTIENVSEGASNSTAG